MSTHFFHISSLLLLLVTNIYAQNIAGNYSKKLDHHTIEKLNLKANNVFKYTRISFGFTIQEQGTWTNKQGHLILQSKNITPKFQVITDYSKKIDKYDLGTAFTVKDQQGTDVQGYILKVFDQEETFTFEKISGNYWVSGKVDAFVLIDRLGYQYPKYTLKKKQNIVQIVVEKKDIRVFKSEAWKIHQGKITPKNMKGKWENYQLMKN